MEELDSLAGKYIHTYFGDRLTDADTKLAAILTLVLVGSWWGTGWLYIQP